MCRRLWFSVSFAVAMVMAWSGAGFAQSENIWMTPVNVIAGQDSLVKFGGCDGCPDAGARTAAVVESGDAVAQFAFPSTTGLALAGLATDFSVTNINAILFGIRVQGGIAEVREGGVYRTEIPAEPGATFRIAVTSGTVTYAKDGEVFYTSLGAATYPLTFGAILAAAGTSIDSVIFGGGAPGGGGGSGTIWSAPVNAIAGQDSLAKLGGCEGCPDAGARTTAFVASGDAVAQFVFPDTMGLAVAGLTTEFFVTDVTSIDFGVRVQGGFAEVREGGLYRTDVVAEPGATFRIAVTGGTVTYAKNGTVFYTSTLTPTYPFAFGAILANTATSIESVVFGGGTPGGGGGSGTIWSAPVNAIAGQDSLVKLGGCDGCPDAGARTTAEVATGDAIAQFAFPDTSGLALVGLASDFSVADLASIEFGIRVQGGIAEVREDGVYRTDIPAEPGATFRIAVTGGIVTYEKNGTVFYTSTGTPSYPFALGAVLSSPATSVTSVTFGPGTVVDGEEENGEEEGGSAVSPAATPAVQ
jgi:guanyl-specific ribonuclease Sa